MCLGLGLTFKFSVLMCLGFRLNLVPYFLDKHPSAVHTETGLQVYISNDVPRALRDEKLKKGDGFSYRMFSQQAGQILVGAMEWPNVCHV